MYLFDIIKLFYVSLRGLYTEIQRLFLFLLIECCFHFFTCVPTIEITKYLSSLLECLDVYWLTKFELLPFCVKMEDYICYKLALKALDLNPFTWWTCSERISEKEVKFMALSVVTLECLAFLFER